jgi:hypothetical protein
LTSSLRRVDIIRDSMMKWWWVLISGALGGALCGFITLALPFALNGRITEGVLWALHFGPIFGCPAGLLAFPVCYYVFLRQVPLRILPIVIIPATIVAPWIVIVAPVFRSAMNSYPGSYFYAQGAAICGVVASSIALSLAYRRSKPTSA